MTTTLTYVQIWN